jgi:hypothetical protein
MTHEEDDIRLAVPTGWWMHLAEELGSVLLNHQLLPTELLEDGEHEHRGAFVDYALNHEEAMTVLRIGAVTVTIPKPYLEEQMPTVLASGVDALIQDILEED